MRFEDHPVLFLITILLQTLGFTLNSLLLYILAKFGYFTNFSFIIAGSLAVNDNLYHLGVFFLHNFRDLAPNTLAHLRDFTMTLALLSLWFGEALHMTLIAFHRLYVCVLRRTQVFKGNPRTALYLCAVIWGLTVAWGVGFTASPLCCLFEYVNETGEFDIQGPKLFAIRVPAIAGVAMMLLCYAAIYVSMTCTAVTTEETRKRIRACTQFIVISVAFALSLVGQAFLKGYLYKYLLLWANILQTSINPVIFFIYNRSIRSHFMEMFGKTESQISMFTNEGNARGRQSVRREGATLETQRGSRENPAVPEIRRTRLGGNAVSRV